VKDILSKIAEVDYYVRWYSSQHDLGIWPSRRVGGSAEFEAIEEYQLGDNPRSINWAATARTGGHRILKNLRLTEAKLAVFFVVDLSRSMDFGTTRVTKRRLAAEITAILAHAAWRCGDKVGFIGYGSDVEVQWPLRSPKDYRFLIPQKILETKAGGHGEPSLGEALWRLPPKRSLVFLVSDFQEGLEGIEKALRSVALVHDVVSLVLWDPREKVLPERRCIVAVKDLESGRKKTVWLGGTGIKRSVHRKAASRDNRLRTVFQTLCMDAHWIHQETDYVRELSKLFVVRRRAN